MFLISCGQLKTREELENLGNEEEARIEKELTNVVGFFWEWAHRRRNARGATLRPTHAYSAWIGPWPTCDESVHGPAGSTLLLPRLNSHALHYSLLILSYFLGGEN